MLSNALQGSSLSVFVVFIQGLLSFFSPCVVLLIPIYVSYLAGNAKTKNEDGTFSYHRGRMFFHTIFFVLGISVAFFLLGISLTALGRFFSGNRNLFTKIGGILIILMGLVQIGFLESKVMSKTHKVDYRFDPRKSNPLYAFLLGFTFSFAWTPCVGPVLSSVLIFASSAKSALLGNLLILVYTAGFVIPFLLLGLFTTQVLNFLKAKKNALKYTVRIGGALMILIGASMFTGVLNDVSGYLSLPSLSSQSDSISQGGSTASSSVTDSGKASSPSSSQATTSIAAGPSEQAAATAPASQEPSSSKENPQTLPISDFTLKDQYDEEWTLSKLEGKTIFLNFFATWCPPCRGEMPHIQELYEEYGKNEKDVIILTVASPNFGRETDEAGILKFFQDNHYTMPVLFDTDGSVFGAYSVQSLPTTFMINPDNRIYGYVPGALAKDTMKSIIQETQRSSESK